MFSALKKFSNSLKTAPRLSFIRRYGFNDIYMSMKCVRKDSKVLHLSFIQYTSMHIRFDGINIQNNHQIYAILCCCYNVTFRFFSLHWGSFLLFFIFYDLLIIIIYLFLSLTVARGYHVAQTHAHTILCVIFMLICRLFGTHSYVSGRRGDFMK